MKLTAFIPLIMCGSSLLAAPPATQPAADAGAAVIPPHVNTYVENRELARIKHDAATVRDAYRGSDPERYAELMLELCNVSPTVNFNTEDQWGLASDLATQTLEVRDIITSLNVLAQLAGSLRYDRDQHGMLRDNPRWPAIRAQQAEEWLSVWQRLTSAANAKIDPKYMPVMDEVVAGFPEVVVSGADPSMIKNPQRRQAYEQAMATQNAKAQAYHEHELAGKLVKDYRDPMVDYLSHACTKPPANVKELEKLMETYKLAEEDRRPVRDRLAGEHQSVGH